ncbi:C4-dicarboxylate ABC transporter substrate-binding protein [Nitratireductor sp. CAU 1489]|uniref:C4-dicarboxylate ABC transporter substrate-binding protein n=1 Tax=Nitratireductor arenosus TaxID=2682096 RepID=A0A844QHC3_9HYPH|nr:TRAP transporter substrate-binding protein [Nitratireductor arenosus]MVA98024.1 C4-dicarboxylate ABC transporter substrate-binding protein [Nitratireductor arenosus]
MKLRHWIGSLALAAAVAVAPPVLAQTVKVALDSPPDLEQSGTYVWAHAFATYLNENGIEAEEFQRGALGEEAERLDQVSQGLLEVSMSDVKSAGTLDTLIYGVYLPYFFDDLGEVDKALYAGGMLEKINAGTTPKGVRVLGVAHLGLPAGIFNTKKPVAGVADMAGLRMRALDEIQISLFEAWGSTGTIVSWAEVPNALQTGVADGYINPPFVPLLFGHTGFIKHFTDAGTSPSVRLAIASEDWYQGLSEEERRTVDDAVKAADKANRAWLEKRSGILSALEEAGIAVTRLTPEARAEFREKSRAVYTAGPVSADQLAIWSASLGR